MRAAVLALLLLVMGCATGVEGAETRRVRIEPGPIGRPVGPNREQAHGVPVTQADGSARIILLRLCRPAGDAPAQLVVINHGSPGNPEARQRMRPGSCESEPVRWFLARGMVVALPLRRGYGTDDGDWSEDYGRCERPDFIAGGRETARDIAAAIAYARGLPPVRRDVGALVVGQSAGGWGAMALAAETPRDVAGLINFAGGRAGRRGGVPNANCRPDLLVAAAGQLGATARGVPMLWIYAANDSFFAPNRAAEMHAAWREAGARAALHLVGFFGNDGHALFAGRGGSAVWGPILEAYMREQRIAPAGPGTAAPRK